MRTLTLKTVGPIALTITLLSASPSQAQQQQTWEWDKVTPENSQMLNAITTYLPLCAGGLMVVFSGGGDTGRPVNQPLLYGGYSLVQTGFAIGPSVALYRAGDWQRATIGLLSRSVLAVLGTYFIVSSGGGDSNPEGILTSRMLGGITLVVGSNLWAVAEVALTKDTITKHLQSQHGGGNEVSASILPIIYPDGAGVSMALTF